MEKGEYIIYEQPLNERIRTYLRLEHVFKMVEYHSKRDTEWDSRNTIINLLNALDILSRSDIKADLIKELEKHSSTLSSLYNNPNADQERLTSIHNDITDYLSILRDTECQPGNIIRQNELISAIKQRSTITGGSCNFDLPNYHYWLNQPFSKRINDIDNWVSDLNVISDSIQFSMFMLRNSTTPTREIAKSGFYQQPIESNMSCQLIRIILDRNIQFYPEISGGKHRFTVRFLQQADTNDRPVQTKDDIEFELHRCIL